MTEARKNDGVDKVGFSVSHQEQVWRGVHAVLRDLDSAPVVEFKVPLCIRKRGACRGGHTVDICCLPALFGPVPGVLTNNLSGQVLLACHVHCGEGWKTSLSSQPCELR